MTQSAPALLRLPPDAMRAAVAGREDPWSSWARGVAAVACGDFRPAFEALQPLARTDGEVAGMAAARIGSALRQIDEHAAAEPWDARACESTGQAVPDGWIGRAADSVGLGDADLAARHLDRAAERCSGWRDPIRVCWVSTEIALLRGDVAAADDRASRALALSETAGSPRHLVKSRLFLGAVRREARPQEALPLLRSALAGAEVMQLLPLLWPAVVVLGAAASADERAAAAAALGRIAARLPDGYGSSWLARPDISALLDLVPRAALVTPRPPAAPESART